MAARRGAADGSAPGMADLGQQYAARAAAFRRVAAELRSPADRSALLAIAEEYEAEAERLKTAPEAG
jgi:hypothetical protein